MQYVRSISGSVSKTWNSINPATLSGAIDVIVVEHEDGTLACSPFHVRFGKFSLLRPHEKKVDFKVNGEKQDFPMKLGEGGEAFFVFETTNSIPEALQTSPLVSPATSPEMGPSVPDAPALQEPEPLELGNESSVKSRHEQSRSESGIPIPGAKGRFHSDSDPQAFAATTSDERPSPSPTIAYRAVTDETIPLHQQALSQSFDASGILPKSMRRPSSPTRTQTGESGSPPPVTSEEAMTRAINLSKKLWGSNIPSQVTDKGDLMLDMTGYKSSDDEALRAEVIARKILSEELEGSYDIGSLIGADEKGNLWIYSSEEAKEQANRRIAGDIHTLQAEALVSNSDAMSDPGYHSDDARSDSEVEISSSRTRHGSDSAVGMSSPPHSPDGTGAGDSQRNYAKTLRLTSDQLKTLNLQAGQNTMSFTVNRATCIASLYLWRHDVPIVISDIDGTITKSDALGHVLTMIGRDWTHLGVAKLYTDIAANGYNLLYLTSRSVGQADMTRTYLAGVVQEGGNRLPKGPVIMSPDRTIAALRREIYLRKPEIFKMACLRDIMSLFAGASSAHSNDHDAYHHHHLHTDPSPKPARGTSPFYAGFGNRLTDALSYRSVNIPSTRIFTINSSAEVSLDLLSLNKYKTGYSSMREIVDHFFPPVGLLVKGGGEEFTDFNYWRDRPLSIGAFSGSESADDDEDEELRGGDSSDPGDGDESFDEDGDDGVGGQRRRSSQPNRTTTGLKKGAYYNDRSGTRIEESGRNDDDIMIQSTVLSDDGDNTMYESFVSEAQELASIRKSLEESLMESVEGEDEEDDIQEEDEDDEGEGEEDDENEYEDEGVVGSLELTERGIKQ